MPDCLKNNPELAPKSAGDKVAEKIFGKFDATCRAAVENEGKRILQENMDLSGMSAEELDGRMSYLKGTKNTAFFKGLKNIGANTDDPQLQKNIARITASL